MPKEGYYIRLKNYGWKANSPFMIYADFDSVFVPEDYRRQNPKESYLK